MPLLSGRLTSELNGKVVASGVIIIIVLIIVLSGIYSGGNVKFGNNEPIIPLKYSLDLSLSNGTVLQGQILNITVTAGYLQGTPGNVDLSADSPSGVNCIFLNTTGIPTAGNPFKSTLQISVGDNVSSGTYRVNVTSAAKNSETNSANLTINVLNAFINVSGTVTANLDERMWPTAITFVNIRTREEFTAPVWTTSVSGTSPNPISGIIQTGRYSILLLNEQDYSVTCSWSRFLMFGGTGDATGSYDAHNLAVNCGVSADSMSEVNYYSADYYPH